jgi:serine/threonine-protein kinase RsbW
MPTPSETIISPSRTARTRVRETQITPLDISVRADTSHAWQSRIALRQWLHTTRVAPALADNLALAGYEALANVVEHAYPPDHPHPTMRLQAQMSVPMLRITITDHGRWRSPTQNADDRSLGLAIMRAVTTFPHVIRHTHGITVVLFAGLAIRRSRGRIMLPPAYASRCSTDSVSRQEKHY